MKEHVGKAMTSSNGVLTPVGAKPSPNQFNEKLEKVSVARLEQIEVHSLESRDQDIDQEMKELRGGGGHGNVL